LLAFGQKLLKSGKALLMKGVDKLKVMLTPKVKFKLGTEDHELWVAKGSFRNVVMMASEEGRSIWENKDASREIKENPNLCGIIKDIENDPTTSKVEKLADGLEAGSKGVSEATKGGNKSENNIHEFINEKKSFDEVLDDYSRQYANVVYTNKKWSWNKSILGGENLSRGQKDKIKERAVENGYIPAVKIISVKGKKVANFRSAGVVVETVKLPQDKWLLDDPTQFDWLDEQIGGHRDGYTWHHSEIPGQMELIPFGIHNIYNHDGGRSLGMWAHAPR
jgi:hypothetical protein